MTPWLVMAGLLAGMGVAARFVGKRGSRDVMWIAELLCLVAALACLGMAAARS